MRNKIISLASVLFMLFASFQTVFIADISAAEVSVYKDVAFEDSNSLLSALGILSVEAEDSQKGISRREFAKMVTLLIGMDVQSVEADVSADKFTANVYEYDDESWRYKGELEDSLQSEGESAVYSVFKDVSPDDEYYNSIKYLAGAGIMTGSDGYFYPERMVTMNEAVKVAAIVLNIGFLNGDDFPAGYITEVSKLDVLDNVENYDGNARLTRRNASVLFYNVLHSNVYEHIDITNDSLTWKLNRDTYMMNEALDLYKIEGVVTSDGITGISKTSEKEGYISVDGQYYRLNGLSSDGLIGRYSVVYYRKGANKINDTVFIKTDASENKELILSPGDIKDFSHSLLTYYDENAREKTFKISGETEVIYNGVVITNYTADIFNLQEGTVTLISNDGNSQYDVIEINKEQIMIAGTIDEYNETIYDKLDSSFFVNLDGMDYKLTDVNGVESEFKSITENNVLSVSKTLPSQKKQYAVITVSQRNVVGEVSAKYIENGNEKIEIDGVGREISYRTEESGDILLGESYKFYFDKNGKIACFTPHITMQYGYLVKAGTNGGGLKSNYQVKIFCDDGEFRIYTLKDKITLDNKNVEAGDACSKLSAKGGELIRFTAVEDVITDILRADADADKFAKIYTNDSGKSYTYRSVYGEYSGFFSDKPLTYTTADTILMNIPAEDKDNEDLYYIEGYSSDETATISEIYASNINSMVADVIIVYSDEPDYGASAAPYGSSGVTAISGVSVVVNEDGEEQTKIKGYLKGKETEIYTAESSLTEKAKTLKAGDLAVITNNSLGNAKAFTKIFDVDTMQMVKGAKIRHGETAEVYNQNIQVRPSESSKFSVIYRTIHGRVYNKYAQEGYFGIAPYIYEDGTNTGDIDTENVYGLQIISSRILIFDSENETFEHGSYSDLIDEVSAGDGAEVVVYLYWGTVYQVVVYK